VPSTETALPDLADLDRPALEQLFEAAGLPRFRARQVFRSIYRKGETDFARMKNLGATLQAEISRRFRISTPILEHQDRSADSTRKFLLRLGDGRRIEAVYIPDTPNQTFCISSQVGCAMD